MGPESFSAEGLVSTALLSLVHNSVKSMRFHFVKPVNSPHS